jgi:hypothetical protein
MATVNWVGRREMCVGGLRSGRRELHVGELHTRVQRARQAEAEVFLASGGDSSLPQHGLAAQRGG